MAKQNVFSGLSSAQLAAHIAQAQAAKDEAVRAEALVRRRVAASKQPPLSVGAPFALAISQAQDGKPRVAIQGVAGFVFKVKPATLLRIVAQREAIEAFVLANADALMVE